MTEIRPFRFGINMFTIENPKAWQDKCRRAEELGYDVLHVPDHLGRPAPFPALVAAASVTERIRVGTFVLNAAFANPALLAREVATADQLTGGRFELGIGAGYASVEFEDASVPFTSAGARTAHLERTVAEVYRRLDDPEHRPAVGPDGVPLLIAGNGDRVLRLAAARADIIGFSSTRPITALNEHRLFGPDAFAERAGFVRAALGDRVDDVELNVAVRVVRFTDDREATAEQVIARFGLDLTVEEVLDVPTVLIGTPEQIAAQIADQRERLGISYYTVHEPYLELFAEVIAAARRRPSRGAHPPCVTPLPGMTPERSSD